MSGEANNGVISEQSSTKFHWSVILSNMDPLCSEVEREIWSVVHDERNVVVGTNLHGEFCPAKLGGCVGNFVAQLHDVHPAV
jgi:hypothetical protein